MSNTHIPPATETESQPTAAAANEDHPAETSMQDQAAPAAEVAPTSEAQQESNAPLPEALPAAPEPAKPETLPKPRAVPRPLALHQHVHATFAVVGDAYALGRVSLVEKPASSNAEIGPDGVFEPDTQGLYRVRVGEHGQPGWREQTIFAGPRAVDSCPAFKGNGRKILGSLFATEPLGSLDLSHVTDAHPWPLLRIGDRPFESPSFANYGG